MPERLEIARGRNLARACFVEGSEGDLSRFPERRAPIGKEPEKAIHKRKEAKMEFTEMGLENGKTLMLLPGTACDYQTNFAAVLDRLGKEISSDLRQLRRL